MRAHSRRSTSFAARWTRPGRPIIRIENGSRSWSVHAIERFEGADAERLALHGRVHELREIHERSQVDHADALEAERARIMAELQSALEAERSRHEEQLRAAEDRSQENAQLVERLKAEILTIAQSRSAPDADLEAGNRKSLICDGSWPKRRPRSDRCRRFLRVWESGFIDPAILPALAGSRVLAVSGGSPLSRRRTRDRGAGRRKASPTISR